MSPTGLYLNRMIKMIYNVQNEFIYLLLCLKQRYLNRKDTIQNNTPYFSDNYLIISLSSVFEDALSVCM